VVVLFRVNYRGRIRNLVYPKRRGIMRVNDIKIAPNFKLYEFECNDGNNEVKIDPLLIALVQTLRLRLGVPLVINSAYRTVEYNKKIGGSPKSQHILGKAVDIAIPKGYTIDGVAEEASKIGFKGIGKYTWGLHLDVRSETARWDYR
jgi:uncharacterized protein YcbK (DUF882 family)